MSTTFEIIAGGHRWQIGVPSTAQSVTIEIGEKHWEFQAVKAVSAKAEYLVIEYRHRDWNPRRPRPFDRDLFIILDRKNRPLTSAANLCDALWSAVTGKPVSELPHTTASDHGASSSQTSDPWGFLETQESVLSDLKRLRGKR